VDGRRSDFDPSTTEDAFEPDLDADVDLPRPGAAGRGELRPASEGAREDPPVFFVDSAISAAVLLLGNCADDVFEVSPVTLAVLLPSLFVAFFVVVDVETSDALLDTCSSFFCDAALCSIVDDVDDDKDDAVEVSEDSDDVSSSSRINAVRFDNEIVALVAISLPRNVVRSLNATLERRGFSERSVSCSRVASDIGRAMGAVPTRRTGDEPSSAIV
jgi:hypothetical protein